MKVFAVTLLLGCAGSSQVTEVNEFVPYSSEFRNTKNVILMINDGASWGTWQAASYWEFGALGKQVYDAFPVKLGVTTFPHNSSTDATSAEEMEGSYDPAAAWDVTRAEPPFQFSAYKYLSLGYTDSAAAATAMATGVKTYNNAINFDNFGEPLPFITQIARRLGKRTGVVTTVEFPHATPAGFSAQNENRNNYTDIAHQMLHSGLLHLVMGGGHPFFTPDGQVRSSGWHSKVNEADWGELASGKLIPTGASMPWAFLQTPEDFTGLASGTLPENDHLLGIFQSFSTTQQGRTLAAQGPDASLPSGIARNPAVPDLPTMTRGALRFLSRGDGGFFLMIEGGATDWAAHTSNKPADEVQYGQLIEETVDFNKAVREVTAWVEANSSWEETLLIITTDHGNGLFLGPDGDRQAFQPPQNRGQGKIPGLSARPTGYHTNELVLLWAKGAGAERFQTMVRGRDPGFARFVAHNDGNYIDNTDIFKVMKAVIEAQP